jgi:hypothetical protein
LVLLRDGWRDLQKPHVRQRAKPFNSHPVSESCAIQGAKMFAMDGISIEVFDEQFSWKAWKDQTAFGFAHSAGLGCDLWRRTNGFSTRASGAND